MGKIKINGAQIYKLILGENDVSKVILNGSVLYEASGGDGFAVQITNSLDEDKEWTDDPNGLYIMNSSHVIVTSDDPLSNATRTFYLPAGDYIAECMMWEMNGSSATGGVTITNEWGYEVWFTVSADGTLNIVGELE